MPVSVEALGIDRLSVAEWLELIEQIWSSLSEQAALPEIPPWHLEELARRRAAAEAHQGGQAVSGSAWTAQDRFMTRPFIL